MKHLTQSEKKLEKIDKFEFKELLDEKASCFLKEIGIKNGQKVLDFGSGEGTYTLPSGKIVGEEGTVFAIDREEEKLKKIEEKAEKEGLKNIRTLLGSDKINIPLDEDSVDFILLINVIHEVENKKKLLSEFKRVLKPKGQICIYPMRINNEKILNIAEETKIKLTDRKLGNRILLFEIGGNGENG